MSRFCHGPIWTATLRRSIVRARISSCPTLRQVLTCYSIEFVLLADGLDVFRVPVPESMVDRSLAESQFRQKTGCNVVAIEREGIMEVNPNPSKPIAAGSELIVVGDAKSEERFFNAIQ